MALINGQKSDWQCCYWTKTFSKDERKACLKKLIKEEPKYNLVNKGKECDPNCKGKSRWYIDGGLDVTKCGDIKSMGCECKLNNNEPCKSHGDCLSKNCFNPRAKGNPKWNDDDIELDCDENGGCKCMPKRK